MADGILVEDNLLLQQPSPSIIEYWLAVKRRRRVVIVITMAAISITAAVTWLRPYQYSAASRIQFRIPIAQDHEASRADRFALVESLISKRTLNGVVDRLELRQQWSTLASPLSQAAAIANLKEKITLSRRSDPQLVDVTATDRDEATALRLSQAMVDVFLSQRTEDMLAARQAVIKGLSDELVVRQVKLDNARKEVSLWRQKLNGSADRSRSDDITMAQLEQQLSQLRLDGMAREIRLLGLEQLADRRLYGAFALLSNDSVVYTALQQLSSSEQLQADTAARYGQDHPEVRRAAEKTRNLHDQLNTRMQDRILAMRTDRKADQLRTDGLQAQVEDCKRLIAAQFTDRAFLLAAQHREELALKSIDELEARIRELSPNIQPIAPPVVIVDTAQISQKPFGMLLITVAGAMACGIGLGIAAALFLDRMNHSFKHLSDLERRLRLPVMGVVGLLRPNSDAAAKSVQKEAFRLMRNQLECVRTDRPFSSLCLLSAGAGEGKSSTVASLASVWVELGLRVLVVDTDLHRPTLHRLLGANNDAGLADYLASDVAIDTIIQSTAVPGVSLIAAGHTSAESACITPERIRKFVAAAAKQFDLVLYDTPAALQISDSINVAREVQSCLLVVQHHGYPQHMARRAVQIVERTSANFVGVVVNKVHADEQNLFFGYEGSYYYARKPKVAAAPKLAGERRRKAA